MKHRNGRDIYGISFEDLASNERSRCNVSPVLRDGGRIVLVASGPQYGAPISAEDLCEEDQRRYAEWLARKIETLRAEVDAQQVEIELLREQLRLAVDQAIEKAKANDVRREAMVEALEAALMVMTSQEVRLEKQADAITMVRSQLARLRDANQ